MSDSIVNFTGLDNVTARDNTFFVEYAANGHSGVDFDKLRKDVAERIAEGKQPAKTFVKALERMNLHRAQYADAMTILLDTYARMVSPQPKTYNATFKARVSLLEGMSDKVLKLYAADYIDDLEEYILPDDRSELIHKLATALSAVESEAVATAV